MDSVIRTSNNLGLFIIYNRNGLKWRSRNDIEPALTFIVMTAAWVFRRLRESLRTWEKLPDVCKECGLERMTTHRFAHGLGFSQVSFWGLYIYFFIFFITIGSDVAVRLANLPLSIWRQTTLLTSMCHTTCVTQHVTRWKNRFTWCGDCGKKQVDSG